VLTRHRDLPPDSKLATLGAETLRGTPQEALAELARRGINRLMVEGGARTARSFLEAGLVDEFHLIRAQKIVGAQGVDALAGMPLDQALQPFRLREQERLGEDVLSVYERRHT
jgi:diaminohydroxyphosphoribosylaminopyrimidine deaminase/5-amino-6-(5-phosphoribosylamino)uracil reductase